MKFYFVKTPHWISLLYSSQIWRFSPKRKNIYLTFDDGPTTEVTNWVLDTLYKYNAKATFFCIGNNIEKYPEIFTSILDRGHAIGNHTYNHEKGWNTKNDNYLKSILKTEKIIKKFLIKNHQSSIVNHKLFRPPYGKIRRSQTKLLMANNYKLIMWSVLSADFDSSVDAEKCLNNVIKNTKSGDIIVFHDSNKAFEKLQIVLPKVLAYFSNKGYGFQRIT